LTESHIFGYDEKAYRRLNHMHCKPATTEASLQIPGLLVVSQHVPPDFHQNFLLLLYFGTKRFGRSLGPGLEIMRTRSGKNTFARLIPRCCTNIQKMQQTQIMGSQAALFSPRSSISSLYVTKLKRVLRAK